MRSGAAMTCGVEDYVCLFAEWIGANPELLRDIPQVTGWVAKLSGYFQEFAEWARREAEAIVALFSLAFGIWRWWVYRERILHKRLVEYLDRSGKQLRDARQSAVRAIERPSPRARWSAPIFAPEALRRLLRRQDWEPAFVTASPSKVAEWAAQKAQEDVRGRVAVAERAIGELRAQAAAAHIMHGAIASARSDRAVTSETRALQAHIALEEFRNVLRLPGFEGDLVARELEAHQLRKLGRLQEASIAYQSLEDVARLLGDPKERDLIVARSRRHRAEILQAQADGGAQAAYLLMKSQTDPDAALTLRARHGPYQEWDAIEQADMHFVTAYLAHRLNYVQVARNELREAASNYSLVKLNVPLIGRYETRRLKRAAVVGLKRVKQAKEGNYPEEWILPPRIPLAIPLDQS